MASRINQSLSFHTSPESFISSRLQQLTVQDPDLFPRKTRNRTILRASILNRNVHIVSDYELCDAILNEIIGSNGNEELPLSLRPVNSSLGNGENDEEYFFAAEPAYDQFMSAFFPGPNILLQDGHEHSTHKSQWKHMLEDLPDASIDLVKTLVNTRFVNPVATSASEVGKTKVDLYDTMKSLAWDLLLGIFLDLNRIGRERNLFAKFEQLQEDLLRGQFSLFPVNVWTPFWSSPKNRGLKAVQEIKEMLKDRVSLKTGKLVKQGTCPYMQSLESWNEDCFEGDASTNAEGRDEDVISHTLLFTSSIANKAVASLLTAYILNLFLWRNDNGASGDDTSLAHLVRSQADPSVRKRMLESILYETERLSPPVVGVMRRVTQEVGIQNQRFCKIGDTQDSFEHKIPGGHDAWLYLAGASRDPAVFDKADEFVWDRYMTGDKDDFVHPGFAFGAGPKTCLGKDLARQICLTVADSIVVSSKLRIEGEVADRGVRYWLGWENDVPLEEVAKDLKQLPCQRPRRPVTVDISIRDA